MNFEQQYGDGPKLWSNFIETKNGTLSIEATAAVFHELIDELFAGFLVSNGIALPDHASHPKYMNFREQVFRLCDAWHWLHMELFDEHKKALRGNEAETIRQKGAARNADRGKLKESIVEERVRLFCRILKGKSWARKIAETLRSEINLLFKKQELTPYSEEVLIKTIRRIIN